MGIFLGLWPNFRPKGHPSLVYPETTGFEGPSDGFLSGSRSSLGNRNRRFWRVFEPEARKKTNKEEKGMGMSSCFRQFVKKLWWGFLPIIYIYITFRVLVCGCEICAFKSETVRKDNDIHHFLPPSILNQKKIMKLFGSDWTLGCESFSCFFCRLRFLIILWHPNVMRKNLPQIYHTLVLQTMCENVNRRRDWSTRA